MSRTTVVNPVRYGKCNNNHKFLTGGHATDGCMEFMPTQSDPYTCDACGCHRSFHRKDNTPLVSEPPRYEECCKNRVLKIKGYPITDGCLEFWPKDQEAPAGSQEPLMCAACGCHRNFHKRKLGPDVVAAAPKRERQPSPAYSDDYY